MSGIIEFFRTAFDPVIVCVVIFCAVLIAIGLIIDREKTWKILQWVLIGLGVILLGWVAITFKVNIGKYLNKILGRRKRMPMAVLGSDGSEIGTEVDISPRTDPIRDRGVIETSDGQKIELPKGVADSDVKRLIRVGDTRYEVKLKHEKATDVFDNYMDSGI